MTLASYKLSRAEAKALVRADHRDSWDHFISEMEHDLHGWQITAYKAMKILNEEIKEHARPEFILVKEWERYYNDLWYEDSDLINSF